MTGAFIRFGTSHDRGMRQKNEGIRKRSFRAGNRTRVWAVIQVTRPRHDR